VRYCIRSGESYRYLYCLTVILRYVVTSTSRYHCSTTTQRDDGCSRRFRILIRPVCLFSYDIICDNARFTFIIIIVVVVVVVDYGRRRNASVSASLATCYYYIHVLPTLRIDLQFQCRWPGDHTQNHNFSNVYLVCV